MPEERVTDKTAQRWFSGSERSVSASFDDRETSDSRSLCIAVAQSLVHREPRKVLDIGCGTGEMTSLAALTWPSASVIGIDPLSSAVDEARQRHPHDNLKFEVLSAEDLSPEEFPPADLILCHLNLGLWADPVGGLEAATRLLAPGGLCYVVDLAAPTGAQESSLLGMARTNEEREYLTQQFSQAFTLEQAQDLGARLSRTDSGLLVRVAKGGLAGYPFSDPRALQLWSHPAVQKAISEMDSSQQSTAKIEHVLYWEIRRAG